MLDTYYSKSPQGRYSQSHHLLVSGVLLHLHSKTQQYIPHSGQRDLEEREDNGAQRTKTKGDKQKKQPLAASLWEAPKASCKHHYSSTEVSG